MIVSTRAIREASMSSSLWAMTVIMALGGDPYGCPTCNNDTLLPYDSQEAWMHGYFQEIGPYPGSHYFRPYNYKHVLSQVDLAYRWGQPQGMPYSQQWWHRYHSRAAL